MMRFTAQAGGAALEEIEAVYRARYPGFLRVAVAIAGDEGVAADAVHDAFVRAVRHRSSFRGEGSLEGWLWRAVVNAARRARGKQAPLAEALAEPAVNGHAPDREVRALVAALPERQRLALFLRYYADLDYRAIAQALGVKPGTVAATLNAAHTTLRSLLEDPCRT